MHSLHILILQDTDMNFVIGISLQTAKNASLAVFSMSHSITYSYSVSQASEMLSSSTDSL